MILIGRLKSLTKIEGRIQVYSTDKNQSELFDGFGLIFTACKIKAFISRDTHQF